MNSYILLRNNKESSSLNLDALKQIGLKPNDLIWVECQSVCWQHPHEIAELKALVSANNSNQPIEQVKSKIIESNTNLTEVEVITEVIPETKTEKKLVFVELPASMNSAKKQNTYLSDMAKYGGIDTSGKQQTAEKSENINTKYSRPLDEIKEMYVKNLEKQEQHKKSSFKIKLPTQFKKIAVYTGLVVLGAGLMFLINMLSGEKKPPITQQNLQKPTVNNTTAVVPAEVKQNIIPEPVYETDELPADEVSFPQDDKKNYPLPVKKIAAEKKEDENLVTQDINKGKVEPEKAEVKQNTEQKVVSVESISSKLSLNANEYGVGSFGGIRNLEMTLHNDSKYLLDKVSAELQYLNPEGVIIKTEVINFQSVSPGQKETVAVKKSKRGVKVNYKITGIESKVITNGTAGL
jgi:hypothetical protein